MAPNKRYRWWGMASAIAVAVCCMGWLALGIWGHGAEAEAAGIWLAGLSTLLCAWLVWNTSHAVAQAEYKHQRVQQKMLDEQRQLAEGYENAPVALFLLGGDGRVLRSNQAMLELLGYAREEWLGRDFASILPAQENPPSWLPGLVGGQRIQGMPLTVLTREGQSCEVLLRAVPVRTAKGFQHAECSLQDVTAFNRLVRELQQSTSTFQFAAKTAGFGFHEYDIKADRGQWSPELYDITGVPAGTEVSMEWVEKLFHPEDRAPHLARMMESLDPAGKGEFDAEFRIVRPDNGQTRWVHNTCRTVFHGEGEARTAVRNVGIIRDVTARKESEQQLKESEERYRAFIRHSSEGIWRLEFDPPIDCHLPSRVQMEQAYQRGTFAECNEVMARMYGLSSPADLVGRKLDFMLPPELPEVQDYLLSIIEGGYSVDATESEEKDVNGHTVYFSNSVAGVVEQEQLTRMWGTQRDITEWKRSQEALVHGEKKFREVFTNAAVGMALLDLEGRWIQVNDLVCTITGYAREALVGQTFGEITHPEDYDKDWEKARQLLKGEISTYSLEKRYLRPGGGVVWVNLTVSLLEDLQGQPLNFISVMEDISPRVETAEALNRSMEEATRSRELAEAASLAKDHFLAALSHELRTPLTPVLMCAAELASDTTLPPEVQEQLQMISRNVTLEARLIDDLLDLTRISRGKLLIDFSPVDVHALLGLTEAMIRSDIRERQLDLQLDLQATGCWVSGDGVRLQQVFWNLLRNAVKFTPEQGRIRIRTHNPAPGEIEVEVSDTGCGISAEELATIFQPFEQGSHHFGGLGLGLSISDALIKLHHGKLEASSPGVDQGAVFKVSLTTIVRPGAFDKSGSAPAALSHGKGSLLFVEDDPATLEAASRLLRRRGYAVVTASSVNEALDHCRTGTFDLVITDIGLPDGSGMDLMREISQRYGSRGIAVSGFGMENDLRDSREAGFSLHLVKPLNISQLTEGIETVLHATGRAE